MIVPFRTVPSLVMATSSPILSRTSPNSKQPPPPVFLFGRPDKILDNPRRRRESLNRNTLLANRKGQHASPGCLDRVAARSPHFLRWPGGEETADPEQG